MKIETKMVVRTEMEDEFFNYGFTHRPHTLLIGVVEYEGHEEDLCRLGEVCDSMMAFMTDEQLAEWMEKQRTMLDELASESDPSNYIDGWTGTFVFDLDGRNFVIVSDCGGEFGVYDFEEFCEERDIGATFVMACIMDLAMVLKTSTPAAATKTRKG
jgi:hypothetical protein